MPSGAGGAEATGGAAVGPAPPVADDPKADVHVTPQQGGQPQQQPIAAEEKIEYRDEEGNLLDEDQVQALAGKVSFSTRYETRTRLVDENGNEVADDGGVEGTVIDGAEPGTANDAAEGEASKPGHVGAKGDVEKEKKVEDARQTAEPESELGKETGKDEL